MAPITIIHVAAGTLGLLSGIVVMSLPNKGNKTHKRTGMFYFISMMISTVLSIYMSIVVNKTFLLAIGCFTLYMLLAGFITTPKRFYKFKYLFIPLGLLGLLSGIYMVKTGIVFLIVFGGLQLGLVAQDLVLTFRKRTDPLAIVRSHIGKMAGSFIAATTAFAVNIIFTGGEWWQWLLPTFIITPLITRWNIQLARKKKKAAPLS